jgi:hypothetical protein
MLPIVQAADRTAIVVENRNVEADDVEVGAKNRSLLLRRGLNVPGLRGSEVLRFGADSQSASARRHTAIGIRRRIIASGRAD